MKTNIILSKDLNQYCCYKEDDFFKILKKINKNHYKFLIVITKNKKTIGTITDGDIRRSLLKLSNKKIKINDKMNKKFIFGSYTDYEHLNTKLASNLLKSNNLNFTFLPIVDENKLIKKILILTKEINKVNILILAGGKGSRLGKLTKYTPKPLLKIKKKTILEIILNSINKIPKNKIYISINYKKEQIINKVKSLKINNIDFLSEKRSLGTAGPLSLLKQSDNDLIVINGDVITSLNYDRFLEYFNDKSYDVLIASSVISKEIDFGVLETKKDNLISIREKPKLHFNIASGIYLFKSRVLKELKKVAKIEMPEFINQLLDKKYSIGVFPMYEKWTDIGTPKSLKNERK